MPPACPGPVPGPPGNGQSVARFSPGLQWLAARPGGCGQMYQPTAQNKLNDTVEWIKSAVCSLTCQLRRHTSHCPVGQQSCYAYHNTEQKASHSAHREHSPPRAGCSPRLQLMTFSRTVNNNSRLAIWFRFKLVASYPLLSASKRCTTSRSAMTIAFQPAHLAARIGFAGFASLVSKVRQRCAKTPSQASSSLPTAADPRLSS